MTKKCQDPKPFRFAPEVCDSCGGLLADHVEKAVESPDFVKAMWKVLLEIGGTWSYYGDRFEGPQTNRYNDRHGNVTIHRNEMAEILFHLESCEIDWKQAKAPRMDEHLRYFAGTFTDNEYYSTGLVGHLHCKCHKYAWREIGTKEITLSQLIWRVVHADDEVGDVES